MLDWTSCGTNIPVAAIWRAMNFDITVLSRGLRNTVAESAVEIQSDRPI